MKRQKHSPDRIEPEPVFFHLTFQLAACTLDLLILDSRSGDSEHNSRVFIRLRWLEFTLLGQTHSRRLSCSCSRRGPVSPPSLRGLLLGWPGSQNTRPKRSEPLVQARCFAKNTRGPRECEFKNDRSTNSLASQIFEPNRVRQLPQFDRQALRT